MWAGRCSSPPTTASTVRSCGSPTAPRRARSWSRTSIPAADDSYPLRPDRRGRDVVLHRQRRHPRSGAVEVGRHRGGHGPGQGHQSRLPRAATPYALTDVGGTLFFTADDGTHGRELWTSDGTEAGTVLVKDIHPGDRCGLPGFLTDVGGTLFFTADDGIHGRELWTSDGTEAGTVLVKDIHPAARQLRAPRPDRRGRDVVLRRQGRHPRSGAVDVRRHRGGHGPGQGHQPGRWVHGRLGGTGRHQQGHDAGEGQSCRGRKAGGASESPGPVADSAVDVRSAGRPRSFG